MRFLTKWVWILKLPLTKLTLIIPVSLVSIFCFDNDINFDFTSEALIMRDRIRIFRFFSNWAPSRLSGIDRKKHFSEFEWEVAFSSNTISCYGFLGAYWRAYNSKKSKILKRFLMMSYTTMHLPTSPYGP